MIDGSSNTETLPPPFDERQILSNVNVYDDHRSTAYIKVDPQDNETTDDAIAGIAIKKGIWERQFPAKKVVAMSVVTESGIYPTVVGLLIHYEQH